MTDTTPRARYRAEPGRQGATLPHEIVDGWIIKASRVGIRGEYYGSAERGDDWWTTGRFGGPGAKARALEAIREKLRTVTEAEGAVKREEEA